MVLTKDAARKLDEIKGRARKISTEALVRWLREERENR